MNPIEEKLRTIVSTLSGGKVTPDFDSKAHIFRDLGIESTKALELLFEIEDSFDVAMPDLEYNDCEHLEDLVGLLTKLKE